MITRPDPDAVAHLEQFYDDDLLFDQYVGRTTDGIRAYIVQGFEFDGAGVRVPRPFFQVLHDHAGEKGTSISLSPCPRCHDFSRSWNCPDHQEA